MTPEELKARLGKYAGLLLYPQTEEQESRKLPFTKAYWRIAKMNGTNVSDVRLYAIKENIDLHIDALRRLRDDL